MTDFTISRKIVEMPAPRLSAQEELALQKWVEDQMQEFFQSAAQLMTYTPVMPERVHRGEHWGIYRLIDTI